MYKLDLEDLYVVSFATASAPAMTRVEPVGGDSESSSDQPAWMCTCDPKACLQTETTSD